MSASSVFPIHLSMGVIGNLEPQNWAHNFSPTSCRIATGVTAGPAESNGRLLLSKWRDSLHVTCGLTARTPGSAPGPTLGNEYGKTLPFTFTSCRIFSKFSGMEDPWKVFHPPSKDLPKLLPGSPYLKGKIRVWGTPNHLKWDFWVKSVRKRFLGQK